MLHFENQSFDILIKVLLEKEAILNNITRIIVLITVVFGNMLLNGHKFRDFFSKNARWLHYIWISEIVYFIHVFVFAQENPSKPFAWMDDTTMFFYIAETIIAIKRLEKVTNLDLSFLLNSLSSLNEKTLNKEMKKKDKDE